MLVNTLYRRANCLIKTSTLNKYHKNCAHRTASARLVDVQKINAARSNNVADTRKKCVNEALMAAKVDDMCLREGTDKQSVIDYKTFNGVAENEQENEISGMADMDLEMSMESEKENVTLQLVNELKHKLNWIRQTEYTEYGRTLLETNKLEAIKNELITVATYNVLSQTLLNRHRYLYRWHDKRSLTWDTRSSTLLEEFANFKADIICLQEIDAAILDPFYNRFLNELGYEGVYKQRTHDKEDGCAIYFKSNKFKIVEYTTVEFYKEQVRLLDRDNIGIILKLAMRDRPNVELVVATTHLLYNPKRNDIKLAQTQLMLADIEKLAYKGYNKHTGQAEYLPIIFTGDMNYSPDSAVYQLVTKSFFEYEGMSNKYLKPVNDGWRLNKVLLPSSVGVTDSCQYLSSLSERQSHGEIYFGTGALDHPLNLESVYSHVKSDYPEATTNQDAWLTVDYIFYSQKWDSHLKRRVDSNLKLVSKLTLPNSEEAEKDIIHLPNLACGSDHLPLLATFRLTAD